MEKLGFDYSPSSTSFRVWSPFRDNIDIILYDKEFDALGRTYEMKKDSSGIHECIIEGDLRNKYYTFLVEKSYEVADPYSVASSTNSIRSIVLDMKSTNPEGWQNHKIPPSRPMTEEIIYELNIKDFTFHISSGVKNRGKYLGLSEEGCKYKGLSTGLDHLVELGITAVHLMPIYDFLTVNEEEKYFYDDYNYNWGYDPGLYNVPEGSYSLIPQLGESRIKELKTMIMKLHSKGIKVVLDVVYNHSYRDMYSNFNILCPNYYHRMKDNGEFSNGSGCGNEFATEKPMVREFVINSLKFWLEEYKVDGFRFDLMSLIDRDTMEEIVKLLRGLKSDIILYGEPWTGGDSVLSRELMTTKEEAQRLGIATYNDGFRNALKGFNDDSSLGFGQGNMGYKLEVEKGIKGWDYDFPYKTINYVNSHDNLILYDKIKKSFPLDMEEDIEMYNRFVFSILFLSQGVPFIHEGNETLRTKLMDSNSYKSPIYINQIDWSLKQKNHKFYRYFVDLINIRKRYKEFTMETRIEIEERINFLDMRLEKNLIAYTIKTYVAGEYLLIAHNGNNGDGNIPLSSIKSHISYWSKNKISNIVIKKILDIDGLVEGDREIKFQCKITIPRFSTMVYRLILS